MKQKLTNLIEVRKIIALLISVLFVVLAFLGKIDSKLVEYVITTIIAFYFAKSTALDKPDNTKGE